MTSITRLAACLWLAVLPISALADEGPRLMVNGTGEVSVAPDQARITLGVSHSRDSAAEAMAAMSADLTAVIARLEGAGVAPADLQTSGLSLSPRYDHRASSGEPEVAGYIASSMVTVLVRDLDRLGTILDEVVQDGANEMRGLEFDVADRAPHLDEARRLAVADARRKAEVLADAAGLSLGRVVTLQEGGGGHGPQPMFDMARVESMAVPVAEGALTIAASVAITFEVSGEE